MKKNEDKNSLNKQHSEMQVNEEQNNSTWKINSERTKRNKYDCTQTCLNVYVKANAIYIYISYHGNHLHAISFV